MDLRIYTWESDNKEVRERLQQQAMIMATDIRKFKPYQDNTFFFVSTQDGYIIKGALPDGFPKPNNSFLRSSW